MPCIRQPLAEPKPGVYPKMPESEYHQREAVNASMLKACGSPLQMKRWRDTADDGRTAAMWFGCLVDALLTNPKLYHARVVIDDLSPGAVSKTWAKHAAANPGKLLVPREWEDEAIPAIQENLENLPDVRRLLGMPGAKGAGHETVGNQLPLFWEHPKSQYGQGTGLLCKCLLDHLGVENDRTVIVQIKTTRDTEDGAFGRQCIEMGYDIQAAQEFEGVRTLAKQIGVDPSQIDYWLVAIGNAEPFDVVAYKAPEEFLELGGKRRYQRLAMYAHAFQNDRWPGYGGPSGCVGLDVPEYILKRWTVGVG